MNCPHNRYRVQEYTLGGDKVIKSRRVCVDCGVEFDPSCPHTRSRIQGYSCEGGVIKSCRVCIDCGTEFDYEVLKFDPTELQGDAEAAYYKMEGKIKELKEENAKLWEERDEFKVRIKNAYTFLEERDDELKGVYRLLDERNAEIARLRARVELQQGTITEVINHRDEVQGELAKLQGELRVIAGWAINPNNLFNDTTYKLWLAKGSHIHDILTPWMED